MAAPGGAEGAVKLPLAETQEPDAENALAAALAEPGPLNTHSPTSPAGAEDDATAEDLPVPAKPLTTVKGEEAQEENWPPETEEVTPHPSEEDGKGTERKVLAVCPELVTGSRLDKAVPLQPGHWIKIGRNPKAHLMCNNAGVSRNQCSIKWDNYERKVEIRLENTGGGTLINGKEIKDQQRRYLVHGDRVRIVGKGQTFDFLVDLRPVGLGEGDPRFRARTDKVTKSVSQQRRETLRAQLVHLEKAIKGIEAKAFERETEVYEIQTQRRLRKQEDTERKQQLTYYVEDAERLEKELDESRRNWLAKLDAEHASNDDIAGPVIEKAGSLQDMLDKLEMKKEEVTISINPDNYAVAGIEFHAPSEVTGSVAGSVVDDAEGEEDAFAGHPGLKDGRREDSDEEAPSAKKRAAEDSAGEEAAAFLKDAPAAKKARSEGAVPSPSPVGSGAVPSPAATRKLLD